VAVTTPSELEKEKVADAGDLYAFDERYRKVAPLLTLDQKINAKMATPEIINAHRFDNESNVLVVMATGAEDADLATTQLLNFATLNGVADVSTLDPSTALAAKTPMMVEGRQPANFEAGNERQFMMYLPRENLGELVDAVNVNPSGPREVQLGLGPILAANPAEVEMLLKNAGAAPPKSRTRAAERRIALAEEDGEARDVPGDASSIAEAHGRAPIIPRLRIRAGDAAGADAAEPATSREARDSSQPAQPTSAPSEAESSVEPEGRSAYGRPRVATIRPEDAVTTEAAPPQPAPAMRAHLDDFLTVVVQVRQPEQEAPASTQPASTQPTD
jgi:hypothetical protein